MLVVSLAHIADAGSGQVGHRRKVLSSTAGDDARAVGAERHAVHGVCVARERIADRLAGVDVPQPYCLVGAAGDDSRVRPG